MPCGRFRSAAAGSSTPSQDLDQIGDLWISRGRILPMGGGYEEAEIVIDAQGMIVCPGLIDIHVHLREPGNEEDETIATGASAALAGGVTSVACMPNTMPAIDTQAAAEFVVLQAQRARQANVYPVGAVSKGRKGEELAELGQLVAGGAVAFTDDGAPVASAALMRRALRIRQDVRPRDHAALPGARADRRRRHERGVRVDAAGAGRHARGGRGHHGRPRHSPGRDHRRPPAHPAHLDGPLGRAGPRGQAPRRPRDGRGLPASLHAHRRKAADLRFQLQDEPAACAPGATSRPSSAGSRTARSRSSPPTMRPHAREKKMREIDQAPFGIVGLETLIPITVTSLIEPGHLTWPEVLAQADDQPGAAPGDSQGDAPRPAPTPTSRSSTPTSRWTIDPDAVPLQEPQHAVRRLGGPRPGPHRHRRRRGPLHPGRDRPAGRRGRAGLMEQRRRSGPSRGLSRA